MPQWRSFGERGPAGAMPAGGGLHWDLRGLSVSSAWWAGCSSVARTIGLGTPPGPEPGAKRALRTAGPGFLEESPERCRGQKLCWASLALWAAGRPSRQSTLSGNTSPSPLWEGARTAIASVHTIPFFFFSSEEQVASGTLEKQPLWEEGRGRGQGAHKASAQEPQVSVPWEEWRLSPPVRVFFSCLFFLF